MTESDLWGKLREANAFQFSQVLAVIAETTGDVCVLHTTGDQRYIETELLKDVIGGDRYAKHLARSG